MGFSFTWDKLPLSDKFPALIRTVGSPIWEHRGEKDNKSQIMIKKKVIINRFFSGGAFSSHTSLESSTSNGRLFCSTFEETYISMEAKFGSALLWSERLLLCNITLLSYKGIEAKEKEDFPWYLLIQISIFHAVISRANECRLIMNTSYDLYRRSTWVRHLWFLHHLSWSFYKILWFTRDPDDEILSHSNVRSARNLRSKRISRHPRLSSVDKWHPICRSSNFNHDTTIRAPGNATEWRNLFAHFNLSIEFITPTDISYSSLHLVLFELNRISSITNDRYQAVHL